MHTVMHKSNINTHKHTIQNRTRWRGKWIHVQWRRRSLDRYALLSHQHQVRKFSVLWRASCVLKLSSSQRTARVWHSIIGLVGSYLPLWRTIKMVWTRNNPGIVCREECGRCRVSKNSKERKCVTNRTQWVRLWYRFILGCNEKKIRSIDSHHSIPVHLLSYSGGATTFTSISYWCTVSACVISIRTNEVTNTTTITATTTEMERWIRIAAMRQWLTGRWG